VHRAFALAAGIALAGCFSPSTITCSDGTTCPASKACAPAGGGCVDPDQVTACDGLDEGANCTSSSVALGVCQSSVCEATQWTATAVIGGNTPGMSVGLYRPNGVSIDRSGNVYIADYANNRIRRLDPSGIITTVAGTGVIGFSGDGGAATSAELFTPNGVAVDGAGNLFIADTQNRRIRRVDATTGIITTVAGNGSVGSSGDGGGAVEAELDDPEGVAVDGLGNLYIADTNNYRIRRVDTTGVITTIAGIGTAGLTGDGGAAIAAQLGEPIGVAVDAQGNVYIADSANNRIRRIDATGTITTVAGSGCTQPCVPGFSGDGGPATSATLAGPAGVTIDNAGDLYIADTFNQRVRKVDVTGTITTVAGSMNAGFAGDGAAAISAELDEPYAVAIDAAGDIYIADSMNNRIRAVDAVTGAIATVAGNGLDTAGGGAATCTPLDFPQGVKVDARSDLYIVDNGHVWIVDATGVITPFAGNGVTGYSGDAGPATAAELSDPEDVAIDGQGNVYIADSANNRIRRVDPNGVITTVAGTGSQGFDGDGGDAIAADLDFPYGLAFDAQGDLYFADRGNNRIRRVDTAGSITTIAGTGSAGFAGDGSAATSAELYKPGSLAFDGAGNLYIVDLGNSAIRKIDVTGIITTIAGTGIPGFNGDGGLATSALLKIPSGVAVDSAQNIYVSDQGNYRVRKIDVNGIITTAMGDGATGFDGDGGAATSATIDAPVGIGVDATGNLYLADADPERVRRSDVNGVITSVAGPIDPQGMGPLAQAQLADPRALVVAPAFTLVAGGSSGTIQAMRPATAWLDVVAGRYPQNVPTGMLARFRDLDFGTVSGVAYDAGANVIYLTESVSTNAEPGNRVLAITIVDPTDANTWTIAPLANALGTAGFSDGPASTAEFRAPTGLYFDPTAHQLYVADTGNHVIRAIDLSSGIASATVSTIAGVAETRGFFGDGGAATNALLYEPQAITECANGDMFVADTGNQRVRRIAAGTNAISTVLGDGSVSSSGEGSPASSFPVNGPLNLACDAVGNLFVTSTSAVRMVLADTSGVVDGSGPVRTIYGQPPHDSFPSSVTRCLAGLAVVDATTVQVTDSCTGILVELRRQAAP
jgi:sugar lactone lactonase YvrE